MVYSQPHLHASHNHVCSSHSLLSYRVCGTRRIAATPVLDLNGPPIVQARPCEYWAPWTIPP